MLLKMCLQKRNRKARIKRCQKGISVEHCRMRFALFPNYTPLTFGEMILGCMWCVNCGNVEFYFGLFWFSVMSLRLSRVVFVRSKVPLQVIQKIPKLGFPQPISALSKLTIKYATISRIIYIFIKYLIFPVCLNPKLQLFPV